MSKRSRDDGFDLSKLPNDTLNLLVKQYNVFDLMNLAMVSRGMNQFIQPIVNRRKGCCLYPVQILGLSHDGRCLNCGNPYSPHRL